MALTDPSAVAAHLGRLIDDVVAGADAARTGGDILRLRGRFDREWDAAQPGAHLSSEAYDALRLRRGAAEERLTARFVALRDRAPSPEPLRLIDPEPPTVATFFEGAAPVTGWADEAEAAIRAAETRLGVSLPATLRELYRLRNGGPTDFFLATDVRDAPLRFEGEAALREADEAWRTVLPGLGLTALEWLETLGAIGDGIDFGDEDESWRAVLPGIDRLIPISSHGSDLWLCLDYGETAEPSVMLFDATSFEQSGATRFRRPDFSTFFAGLRRHGVTVEDGLAMRGPRVLGEDT